MVGLYLSLVLQSQVILATPKTWYGPAIATFQTQFSGNPYDPDQNDVRVKFTGPDGKTAVRLAYFEDGGWKAEFVAETPGDYRTTLIRNGKELLDAPSQTPTISIVTKLGHGFIHVNPQIPTRFQYDDLTPYYPVGHNLGWRSKDKISSEDQLAIMGHNGLNWTRIWAAEWVQRNPWWPSNDPDALPTELWPPALKNWDGIARACDVNQVPFQMVLFNHGSFSSTTDPDWPNNPWNAAKGGFLKSASDFFTDPEAKRRTKMWLRYAVAKFSSDPNLLSFELFNEVQWTDAAKAGMWQQIGDWHKEMATYIRGLDSYDHMITTSSVLDHPELFAAMDYYQPHLYKQDPVGAMAAETLPSDKPVFYGEFGDDKASGTPAMLRSSMYSAMFHQRSGTPMFWDWDLINTGNFYNELATAVKVAKASQIANHPTAQPLKLSAVGGAATGIGTTDWMMARVAVPTPSTVLSGVSTAEGSYHMWLFDLESGKSVEKDLEVRNYKIPLDLPSKDCIVVFRRIGSGV